MTYLKPFLVSTILATATLSFGAPLMWAQTAPDSQAGAVEKFVAMDTDRNSVVSEAEFVAYAADAHDASEEDARAKFAQIAGDDGELSLAEFAAVHTASDHSEEAPSGS